MADSVISPDVGMILGVISLALHVFHGLIKYANHSKFESACCGARARVELRMEDSPIVSGKDLLGEV